MGLKSFKIKAFTKVVQNGGVLIDNDEWVVKRRTVCEGCEHFKMVHPLPTLEMLGCELCRCPFDTKGYMKNFFNPKTLTIEPTTCKIGKWEEIDKQYLD